MIDKVPNWGDERQKGFCVHCGGPPETQDHAPPKVFLDMPYPPHRPTLPSCLKCNNGFSADEEYLACFVECVVCGTTDPEKLTREKVSKSLRRNRGLRERIERSKREDLNGRGERLLVWTPEDDRVREVVVKLARCHTAYELNEPRLDEPDHVGVWPLVTLTQEQLANFESVPDDGGWPEVGSRSLQRLTMEDGLLSVGGWLSVQDGRYRFMAVGSGSIIIRGVLSEYLGFEVIWD